MSKTSCKTKSLNTNGNTTNKICMVCGDRATAFNFGGQSCETCKIFFRRNAFQAEMLTCTKGGNCQIDVESRKTCSKCRIDKCFAIGMRKELIQSRKTQHKSNDFDELIKSEIKSEIAREERIFYQCELNAHELEQLSEIQNAMSIFTNENTAERVGVVDNCFDAYNLQGLYTKKIIKFCKGMSPYKNLDQRDQLLILKGFHCEIVCIRAAYLFSVPHDGFYTIVNEDGDKVLFVPASAFVSETLDMIVYCRYFLQFLNAALEDDPNLRDLIIAHMLFKPREKLSNLEFVSNQYLVYCRLIRRYLEHKYQQLSTTEEMERKYSSIMLMLNELAYIRDTTQQILRQKDRDKIYTVMVEIYNLDQGPQPLLIKSY